MFLYTNQRNQTRINFSGFLDLIIGWYGKYYSRQFPFHL